MLEMTSPSPKLAAYGPLEILSPETQWRWVEIMKPVSNNLWYLELINVLANSTCLFQEVQIVISIMAFILAGIAIIISIAALCKAKRKPTLREDPRAAGELEAMPPNQGLLRIEVVHQGQPTQPVHFQHLQGPSLLGRSMSQEDGSFQGLQPEGGMPASLVVHPPTPDRMLGPISMWITGYQGCALLIMKRVCLLINN